MLVLDLVRLCRETADDFPGSNFVDWKTDDADCLWSNQEWVAYLSDAQDAYCHRRPIRDAGSTLTTAMVAGGGDGRVDLDPRILYVDRVTVSGIDGALPKGDLAYFDTWRSDWEGLTGDPVGYLDDEAENQIRLVGVPIADTHVHLAVRRLPLEAFDWAQRNTQSPEIPAGDHTKLVQWACGKAFLKRDDETYNKKRSNGHFALFDAQVGPRPDPGLRRVTRWSADRRPRTQAYYR